MRISEKRKSEKNEDTGARKCQKVAIHCVFPMIVAPEGRKVGCLPSGQVRDEKLHAVVARSTCRNQNVQSTACSDHF